VADDAAFPTGDERRDHAPVLAQRVHEVGLRGASERSLVDGTNVVGVGGAFFADLDGSGCVRGHGQFRGRFAKWIEAFPGLPRLA
jgi:hypothetical protein